MCSTIHFNDVEQLIYDDTHTVIILSFSIPPQYNFFSPPLMVNLPRDYLLFSCNAGKSMLHSWNIQFIKRNQNRERDQASEREREWEQERGEERVLNRNWKITLMRVHCILNHTYRTHYLPFHQRDHKHHERDKQRKRTSVEGKSTSGNIKIIRVWMR